MTESALTANRESALLTLLRSEDDWETKRDALAAFDFKPVAASDGPMDDTPMPAAEDSWDELLDAEVSGLITSEQVDEVLGLRSKGLTDEKDAAAPAADDRPLNSGMADRD